jgi:hypothetical protein
MGDLSFAGLSVIYHYKPSPLPNTTLDAEKSPRHYLIISTRKAEDSTVSFDLAEVSGNIR